MAKCILINQQAARYKTMIGYNCRTKKLIKLPMCCLRKPQKEDTILDFPYFCFISQPTFYTNTHLNPFMWLHCYRDENKITSPQPKYLISESDFVDPIHMAQDLRQPPTQDYIYFTISGQKGINYKGFSVFMQILPTLHKLRLKGSVIVYDSRHLDSYSPEILEFARDHGATFIGKHFNRRKIATLMASAKFGLFPNIADCSPRMIPEFFLQNRPVIVNKNIHGGWKYFSNPGFGSLFNPTDPGTIEEAVNHVKNLPRNQSLLWKRSYGFNRMTRKLADLIKKHCPGPEIQSVTHAYFSDFKEIFLKAPEIFS